MGGLQSQEVKSPAKKKSRAVEFRFSAAVCVKETETSRTLEHLRERRNRTITSATDRKANEIILDVERKTTLLKMMKRASCGAEVRWL